MLISTKPVISLEAALFGVIVRKAVSLSAAILLGTSTERADFLKEQIMLGSHLFKDTVLAMSSWLRSFPILRRQPRFVDSWLVYVFVLSVYPWQRFDCTSLSSQGWEGLPLSL